MPRAFEGVKPSSWAKLGMYVLALAAVYYSVLSHLVGHDWAEEDSNYCYLIPLVVLYFIWEKRDRLISLASRVSWPGIVLVCLGVVLFWIGDLAGEFFTLYISFWLVIVGLVWLHFGWEKLKTIWFSMVMMLGMFPLPNILNVRLTFGLKLISSQLGVAMLHLYGMSAYREGNIIDLGFTQLQVIDACSGLRYVMPLLVLSLILAYWFKAHIWKRLFLVVSSIPIAIFVNAFRIAATGILYSFWGASVAEGFFHGLSGWLIFMFTIPVLLIEMWILGKLPPKEIANRESRSANREEVKESEESAKLETRIPEAGEDIANRESRIAGPPSNPKSKIENRKSSFFQPVFVTAIILFALTIVFSNVVNFRENIPIKKPLAMLPLKVGEWTGEREQMEQDYIDTLRFSDYALVDYANAQKQTVNFYTAYYESQRKGDTTHSPETCLPGSGWDFREAGATQVPLGDGKFMRINRAFMEKTGARELTYYWFAQRGRILTNLYQVKFYSFWDALTKHRTDGALIRLITPVYPNEKLEDAEARLQGFTKEIVPVLRDFIPE